MGPHSGGAWEGEGEGGLGGGPGKGGLRAWRSPMVVSVTLCDENVLHFMGANRPPF